MENKEKHFNVEIFEYATGKTEAVIGTNMTEEKAEKRQLSGLRRCNSDYGVRIVEAENEL